MYKHKLNFKWHVNKIQNSRLPQLIHLFLSQWIKATWRNQEKDRKVFSKISEEENGIVTPNH